MMLADNIMFVNFIRSNFHLFIVFVVVMNNQDGFNRSILNLNCPLKHTAGRVTCVTFNKFNNSVQILEYGIH